MVMIPRGEEEFVIHCTHSIEFYPISISIYRASDCPGKLFAHDVDSIPQLKMKAAGLPTCPDECVYNAKMYNETMTSAAKRLELGWMMSALGGAGLLFSFIP